MWGVWVCVNRCACHRNYALLWIVLLYDDRECFLAGIVITLTNLKSALFFLYICQKNSVIEVEARGVFDWKSQRRKKLNGDHLGFMTGKT